MKNVPGSVAKIHIELLWVLRRLRVELAGSDHCEKEKNGEK